MNFVELLGFTAGVFSMSMFIPQIYKTVKAKSAKHVSIQVFILSAVSNSLWTAYGVISSKLAIIVTNVVIFILAIIQIILKIKYDSADKLSRN
jgi:MtN3 and saliva related transmembrane protein